MAGNIFTYRKTIDTIGYLDGEYVQKPPLTLNNKLDWKLRVVRCSLSPMIPNIFNFGGVITNNLRISRNNGASWIDCFLGNRFMSVARMNAALLEFQVDNAWITDPTQPGIVFNIDPSSGKTYFIVDSTKIALATQVVIDLGSWDITNHIAEVLGFTNNKVINLDGTTVCSTVPQMAINIIDVILSFQGSRYLSGISSNVAAEITIPDLLSLNLGAELTFPSPGQISPILPAIVPTYFTGFSVSFIDASTGRQVPFIYGSVSLTIELFY